LPDLISQYFDKDRVPPTFSVLFLEVGWRGPVGTEEPGAEALSCTLEGAGMREDGK